MIQMMKLYNQSETHALWHVILKGLGDVWYTWSLNSFNRFWNPLVQKMNSETKVDDANDYIERKKKKRFIQVFTFKKTFKSRLLIKCAWTNHVWNWIPFIMELGSAKYLLML